MTMQEAQYTEVRLWDDAHEWLHVFPGRLLGSAEQQGTGVTQRVALYQPKHGGYVGIVWSTVDTGERLPDDRAHMRKDGSLVIDHICRGNSPRQAAIGLCDEWGGVPWWLAESLLTRAEQFLKSEQK